MLPQVEKAGEGDGDIVDGVEDDGEAQGLFQGDVVEDEGIGYRSMIGADIARG